MPGVFDFSLTASANGGVDPEINFLENQDANSVNNSARALMRRLRQHADDIGGALVTTNIGNAYSVTTSAGIAALRSGPTLKVKVNIANTGAATLNVDGLGAKAWQDQA